MYEKSYALCMYQSSATAAFLSLSLPVFFVVIPSSSYTIRFLGSFRFGFVCQRFSFISSRVDLYNIEPPNIERRRRRRNRDISNYPEVLSLLRSLLLLSLLVVPGKLNKKVAHHVSLFSLCIVCLFNIEIKTTEIYNSRMHWSIRLLCFQIERIGSCRFVLNIRAATDSYTDLIHLRRRNARPLVAMRIMSKSSFDAGPWATRNWTMITKKSSM